MLMISIKPQYAVNILNGIKTGELRKNVNLRKAVEKEIQENGYCEIAMYVSKAKPKLFQSVAKPMHTTDIHNPFNFVWKLVDKISDRLALNGKVVAKFKVRKVEDVYWEYSTWYNIPTDADGSYRTEKLDYEELLETLCLTDDEFSKYVDEKSYILFIEDLEIYETPKELWQFHSIHQPEYIIDKAPQNFIYVKE